MNVPGWGMPYVRDAGSAVSFSSPYRLMMADPGSEISGNVIPRESENFFSVSGAS